MEAFKFKTLDDLLDDPTGQAELIDGEIVQRPMARMEHGFVQHRTSVELGPFDHPSGPGGWWIATEVSVHYAMHQCPTHDLAGWRKERLPERPRGVVNVIPDWVCEIVSPGHERKDTFTLFTLLMRHRVPYYWLLWPEDRTLITWELDGDSYRTLANLTLTDDAPVKQRIPPFTELEIDLSYILSA